MASIKPLLDPTGEPYPAAVQELWQTYPRHRATDREHWMAAMEDLLAPGGLSIDLVNNQTIEGVGQVSTIKVTRNGKEIFNGVGLDDVHMLLQPKAEPEDQRALRMLQDWADGFEGRTVHVEHVHNSNWGEWAIRLVPSHPHDPTPVIEAPFDVSHGVSLTDAVIRALRKMGWTTR